MNTLFGNKNGQYERFILAFTSADSLEKVQNSKTNIDRVKLGILRAFGTKMTEDPPFFQVK